MSNKVCSRCKIDKTLESYHKNNKSKDGHRAMCKKCLSFKKDKELKLETCICKSCGVEKSITLIGRDKECKDCIKEYNKLRNLKNIIENKAHYDEKKCNRCLEVKNANLFTKTKYNKSGLCSYCKECNSAYLKEYRKNNYKCQTLIVDSKDKRREYYRKRMLEDKNFKLRRNVRNLIKCGFDRFINGSVVKSKSTENILGCSFEEFKNHIEKQFLPWMNWDNHGNCKSNDYNCTWHFDHIIPLIFAKTEEELYLLNHWSNFQPLCGKINTSLKNKNIYECSNIELQLTFYNDGINRL